MEILTSQHRREFRGTQKSLRFILWGIWISVTNGIPIHLVGVKIFYWLNGNFDLPALQKKENYREQPRVREIQPLGNKNIWNKLYHYQFGRCQDIFLVKWKLWPASPTEKCRRTHESLGFNLWGTRISVTNCIPIYFVDVKIFYWLRGKLWPACATGNSWEHKSHWDSSSGNMNIALFGLARLDHA